MITDFREYPFLSNFYPCKIEIAGLTFPSVENAYQAMKCENWDDMEVFTRIKPPEAKKLGRKVKMRADFDSIKYNLMRQLLDLKFEDKDLLHQLWRTTPESIIEGNRWHDNYWGACSCEKCKNEIKFNHLGELLQRKRNVTIPSPDIYTMYGGSIYHRDDQWLIQRPSMVYDVDTYTLLRIGPYDTCEAYLQKCQGAGFNHAALFEFDTHVLSNQRICELMNLCFTHTGYLKRVVTGDISTD